MRAAERWRSVLAGILLLGCARAAAPEGKVDAGVIRPADAFRPADGSADLEALGATGGLHEGLNLPGKCGELAAAWTKRRAAGGQCARAADCACYTASLVVPFHQEATDAATARALAKLARAFSDRSCPTVCAEGTPDRCKAECLDGRCVAVHVSQRGARSRAPARR